MEIFSFKKSFKNVSVPSPKLWAKSPPMVRNWLKKGLQVENRVFGKEQGVTCYSENIVDDYKKVIINVWALGLNRNCS